MTTNTPTNASDDEETTVWKEWTRKGFSCKVVSDGYMHTGAELDGERIYDSHDTTEEAVIAVLHDEVSYREEKQPTRMKCPFNDNRVLSGDPEELGKHIINHHPEKVFGGEP